MKCNKQLKYSNYVAFSHFHGTAVNNSGLLLLYITNILFNKARNSRLSTNGLRCITLATLVLGLYLICKALLLDEDKAYGLLASLEVFFAISSFMMTGLSIPLNIIIEKYLKP